MMTDYSSIISYKYTGASINILLDIEREIKLLIKCKQSVENYIKTIRSNSSLVEVNIALEEVLNTKFQQYNSIK
jgi:hypothetical protein